MAQSMSPSFSCSLLPSKPFSPSQFPGLGTMASPSPQFSNNPLSLCFRVSFPSLLSTSTSTSPLPFSRSSPGLDGGKKQQRRRKSHSPLAQCAPASPDRSSPPKIAKLKATKTVTLPFSQFVPARGKKNQRPLAVEEARQVEKEAEGPLLPPVEDFLRSSEGLMSVLNLKRLRKVEALEDEVYRCFIGDLGFMNFSVEPVCDIRARSMGDYSVVEMLACRLQGSKLLEDNTRNFKASLQNRLKWGKDREGRQTVTATTHVNVELEVFTMPFKALPMAAIEVPGNKLMDAMLTQLLPAFLDGLRDSYVTWGKRELQVSDSLQASSLPPSSSNTSSQETSVPSVN